jgi:Ca2+-binding EF-hand superfamily protein
MKLVPFFVAATLALTGVARADDLQDPYAAEAPPPRERPRHQGNQGTGELRHMLLERFDANGDGRLEPRERRHAVRALRRLERKLARQDGQEVRARKLQKLIRKYDLDGDGNVGPGEMPPRMAKRLRRLDRNGDGWVDQNDFNAR